MTNCSEIRILIRFIEELELCHVNRTEDDTVCLKVFAKTVLIRVDPGI